MIESAGFWDTYWWIIPVVMMIFCFLSMWGKGMCGMMGWREKEISESAKEILERRYASGEKRRSEYEDIMGTISSSEQR